LELRVENYAVIDNVAVEFAPDLNLLTGETGAGKSILIDALALLLGDKASTDTIRHGTDKAVVSAVFEADSKALDAILEDAALAAGCDLAAKNQLAVVGMGIGTGIGIQAIGFQDRIQGFGLGLEDRRNHGLVGAVTNGIGGSFVAEKQSQSVNEDGFSGAGFAGQQIQAGRELHGHVINDRVVFDPQFQ
jgi:energy-coupling factor transporter ATP-binding protein EcfA2